MQHGPKLASVSKMVKSSYPKDGALAKVETEVITLSLQFATIRRMKLSESMRRTRLGNIIATSGSTASELSDVENLIKEQ